MEKELLTSMSRSRDIIKRYADGAELVLIGLENQMNVNYAMPVRSMLYDALDYTRQCKKLKQRHQLDKDLKGADEFLSGLTREDRLHPAMDIYWETLAAIGAATGSEELVVYAQEHKGGRVNMCTALENLKQEGRKEGRKFKKNFKSVRRKHGKF